VRRTSEQLIMASAVAKIISKRILKEEVHNRFGQEVSFPTISIHIAAAAHKS